MPIVKSIPEGDILKRLKKNDKEAYNLCMAYKEIIKMDKEILNKAIVKLRNK